MGYTHCMILTTSVSINCLTRMKDHVETVHLKKGDAFRMRQRPPIHVNCKIFHDFRDILEMGKCGDFHLNLFSRDFTGVSNLIKKIGVERSLGFFRASILNISSLHEKK